MKVREIRVQISASRQTERSEGCRAEQATACLRPRFEKVLRYSSEILISKLSETCTETVIEYNHLLGKFLISAIYDIPTFLRMLECLVLFLKQHPPRREDAFAYDVAGDFGLATHPIGKNNWKFLEPRASLPQKIFKLDLKRVTGSVH